MYIIDTLSKLQFNNITDLFWEQECKLVFFVPLPFSPFSSHGHTVASALLLAERSPNPSAQLVLTVVCKQPSREVDLRRAHKVHTVDPDNGSVSVSFITYFPIVLSFFLVEHTSSIMSTY